MRSGIAKDDASVCGIARRKQGHVGRWEQSVPDRIYCVAPIRAAAGGVHAPAGPKIS
jgi:hypothetical protein